MVKASKDGDDMDLSDGAKAALPEWVQGLFALISIGIATSSSPSIPPCHLPQQPTSLTKSSAKLDQRSLSTCRPALRFLFSCFYDTLLHLIAEQPTIAGPFHPRGPSRHLE
jgi:hypothetical protein